MIITNANIFVVPCGNRQAVLLELETDAGVSGIGEAGIAYGAGTIAAAEMVREMLTRFVIGQDPAPINKIWNTIYDNGFWTKGGGAISIAGLSAIEHALWDIKGKTLGAPVYSLLGGPFTHQLETYANGWWIDCDSPLEYARAAVSAVGEGFRGLKLYPLGVADPVMIVKHPVHRAIDSALETLVVDRCAAMRTAIGPDIAIMLDFGGGLTMDRLLPLLSKLEPYNIAFVEEPVDPALPGALGRVANATGIPIAAGERFYTRYGFQAAIESGGISIAQPDVCNTGGLLEATKIAALAESHNLRVAPHNYGSSLATAISAHLAAAIPNFMTLEVFPHIDKEPGYTEVLLDPLEPTLTNGRLPLPTGNGLGVTLNKDAVQPHLYASVGSPSLATTQDRKVTRPTS